MTNTHTTLSSLFGDIADAIRAKTGGSSEIVADNFPSAIAGIPQTSPQLTSDMLNKKYVGYTNSGSADTSRQFSIGASGAAVSADNLYYLITAMILQDGVASLFGYISALYSRNGDTLTEVYTEAQNVTGTLGFGQYGIEATITTTVPAGARIQVLSMITALNETQ